MAFSYYKPIVIDHTKCGSANSSNFPMLISDTDAALKSVGNGGKVTHANAYDIQYFSDTALTTPLKFETVSWNSSTGKLLQWVKIPTLSSSANTTIYRAYGDASISTAPWDGANTFDSNYKGVWHMEQNPTGSVNDSTGNAHHLTSYGTMTSGDLVTGQVGNGIDFDGSNDRLELADNATLSITGALTLSCWFKMTNNPANQSEGLISKYLNMTGYSAQRSYHLSVTTAGYINSWISRTGAAGEGTVSNAVSGSVDVADGNWKYACAVFIPSTSLKVYINGSEAGSNTTSIQASIYDGTAPFIIGCQFDTSGADYYAAAIIDEVRVSNTNRSTSWITAEYNNQSSPSTFYSVGSEVAVPTRNKYLIVT